MYPKFISLALISYTLCINLHAQSTQKGLVREFNSGKKALPGVGLDFIGAKSTVSDDLGKFTLTFDVKKPGDPISLLEAKKAGYELVNEGDLHSLRMSSDGKLATDLILAHHGVIQMAKAEYEKQKQALQKKIKAAEIKEEEFNEQLRLLQEEFDKQQLRMDALAATFSRVNFDDVSPAYKDALELYKAGKLNEAIARLESQDLAKQVRDVLTEIKRIATLEARLEEDKRLLSEKKKQLIEMLNSLADMYNVNFNPTRAEGVMDTLLLLDSTDLEILQKTADFYREQHRYEKALKIYTKIIAHPQSKEWKKANAHHSVGELYTIMGNLNKALENYTTCNQVYSALLKLDSSTFNKDNLAISFSRLGLTYNSFGNPSKALEFYENYQKLEKELYDAYPNNVDFKNSLAISYVLLGETNTLLGNLNKAAEFFEIEIKLLKELYDAYPNNVEFKNGLAISYERLGSNQSLLGNLTKALEFYENYHKLEKELFNTYTNNVDFKSGLAISYQYLGYIHTSLGNHRLALENYENFHKLEKELYGAYPNNVSFKNSLAVSYEKLGSIHTSLGNLTKALEFYRNFQKLEKELYDAYPNYAEIKNFLAISYQSIGETYTSLGNFTKALEFYEIGTKLFKELYDTNLNNVEFKNNLAISFSKLGETYTSLGNLTKALEFYEIETKLFEELYDVFPNNVEFKNGLAISYYYLGKTIEDSDLIKAIAYLKESVKHYSELIKLSAENPDFAYMYKLANNYLSILAAQKSNVGISKNNKEKKQ